MVEVFVLIFSLLVVLVAASSTFRRRLFQPLFTIRAKMFVAFMDNFQKGYNERMRQRKVALFRNGIELVQQQRLKATGSRQLNIVEIGAGAGANFEFYPSDVSVTCVEPNRFFEERLRRNAAPFPSVRLDKFHVGYAEDMTQLIQTDSVDIVVTTLVMCHATDIVRSLKEIVRILKPGGKYFFMEHIRCSEKSSAYTRLLQSVGWLPWYLVFGCDVSCPTDLLIHQAGFGDVDAEVYEAVEMIQPSPIAPAIAIATPHLAGVATK